MNYKYFFEISLPNSQNRKRFLLELSKVLGIESIIQKANTCEQNKYHNELLLDHLIDSYQIGITYKPDYLFGISCLFHDIGKVIVKKYCSIKQDNTFHKHEYVGALLISKWMKRWRFSEEETNHVTQVIKHHQFRIWDDTKDKTIKKWLLSINQEIWEDIRLLRLVDRMANKQNIKKPVIYQKYIEVDKHISLIANEVW